MKKCFKCGALKPRKEFYRHPFMADGLLGKCKQCTKADVATNYSAKRKQYQAYERIRELRPERKAAKLEYQRNYRARNPEKYRARNIVDSAIRDGRLKRERCFCGKKAQAHHDDYSKPLEVDWVCFKHHRELEHGQIVG